LMTSGRPTLAAAPPPAPVDRAAAVEYYTTRSTRSSTLSSTGVKQEVEIWESKSQIPLRYLVRSWFEAHRRPASNLSATSFEPASV